MMNSDFSFPLAEGRAQALGEVHARPFALIGKDRTIIQLAFMFDETSGQEQNVLCEIARGAGCPPPQPDQTHFSMPWGAGTLRWERHTEFSTYFWECPAAKEFGARIESHPFGSQFLAPGRLISGIRLEIRSEAEVTEQAKAHFDPASLCYSTVKNGQAVVLTDFRQDGDGLTRILVIDKGMTEAGRGALVQGLLAIETYRTLAMLGFLLARSLSPEIRQIEDGLTRVTQDMKTNARENSDALLSDITRLAAELEANAALSLYRFGASKAYYNIVRERIDALGEVATPGYETLGSFLEKRLAPAMRTCRSIEERQANLSRKLARATTLIRSWIDVELERQNATLLSSMDRRFKLQLRLQQTVEGLSVAAIAYYVTGLFSYLAKPLEGFGLPVKASFLTGLFVPVAVFATWLVVRSVRMAHSHDDHSDQPGMAKKKKNRT